MAPPLRVVIADDHHHVLPAIHLAIRRRRLPFDELLVVHVDAHPDLSFPRAVDPALVFAAEELYDALDASVSGIAEFLLPLVYAGHVRSLLWLKPHWAKQSLCVSVPLAHFIDEDAFAPAEDLEPATIKEWELLVAELPIRATESSAPIADLEASTTPVPPLSTNDLVLRDAMEQMRECKGYVLDIDLDYFSTWNPFRKVAAVVARVFGSLEAKNRTNHMPASARVLEQRAFTAAMAQVQTEQLFLDPTSAECRALVATVLLPLYGQDRSEEFEPLLASFFGALAGLDDEARALVWWAGPNMELPHHLSSNEEVERMMAAFAEFLVASGCREKPPGLVTMATSTSDEYLPPHQLASVQAKVLSMLTDVFGAIAVEFVEYEAAAATTE
ncbi:hypothetical protein PybrP1_010237 [[Pythium] brassicae (nom. inval.)]|nr:hypothetical protein PybrP1_010237 [[Pythium] brassicae (nom. inval.)]